MSARFLWVERFVICVVETASSFTDTASLASCRVEENQQCSHSRMCYGLKNIGIYRALLFEILIEPAKDMLETLLTVFGFTTPA